MVRTRIIFCLIIFYIPRILYCAQLEPIFIPNYQTNKAQQVPLEPIYNSAHRTEPAQPSPAISSLDIMIDMITTIDDFLNEKYASNFCNSSITARLTTEEKKFDILNIANEYYDNKVCSTTLFNALCIKNSFFQHAIEYFTKLARNDLDNVTCRTFKNIEDPTLRQATSQLDELPVALRTYVMKLARDKIEHAYQMTLPNSNESDICDFDICPTTHQAAVSFNDKTLRIYDLTRGTEERFCQEENVISAVCFNNNGSQLATKIPNDDNDEQVIIKIWCPQEKKVLHTLNYSSCVGKIGYTDSKDNSILYVEHCSYLSAKAELWSIQEKIKYPLGNMPHALYSPDRVNGEKDEKGEYFANIGFQFYTLNVTKKNCRALYICERAINNSKTKDANKFGHIKPLYDTLTPYEKQIIKNLIKEKAPEYYQSKQTKTRQQLLTNT